MKKIILFATLFVALFTSNRMYAQQLESIPDPNFRDYLMTKFPDCFSGNLLDISCDNVKDLDELNVSNLGISDLTGVRFFKRLHILKCAKNNLTTLDGLLPDSLSYLICSYNKLTALPALPDSLMELECSNNLLTALPVFPGKMVVLQCSNNKLTQLPNLPNTFFRLIADSNMIAALPPLPDSLLYLTLNNNALTTFPVVSNSINKVYSILVSHNKITEVPALPSSLKALNVSHNLIAELPALPAKLTNLSCSNNQLRCLPLLPAELNFLSFEENPITCIPNLPLNIVDFSGSTTTICTAENTLENNCGYYIPASGTVYVDYNGNNIQEQDEPGIRDVFIFATQSNATQTRTNDEGKFTLYLSPGTYIYRANVSDTLFDFPPARFITIQNSGNNLPAYDFALKPTKEIKDLTVSTTATIQPRPGFPASYVISCINSGNYPVTDVELHFSYSSHFSYESTSLPYESHMDTVLTWKFPILHTGGKKDITVNFTLPVSVTLGTLLPSIAMLTPLNTGDAERNFYFLNSIATGSYDPNDKSVLPQGNVSPEFIAQQQDLEYIIRFQNTGTADAINVVVIDTIGSKLDIESLKIIGSSHNYRYEQRGKQAAWVFENIHLPDMHTNEPESHGYVKFTIKPVSNVALGDAITNRAGIVFDFNDPIITNTTETIVALPPVVTSVYSKAEPAINLQVYPNPCTDKVHVTFNALSYSGNASVRVRNNLSQEAAVQSIDLVKGINTLELDVNALPPGMYYIEVTYDGKSYGAKLLK